MKKTVIIGDNMLLPADRPMAGTYEEMRSIGLPDWVFGCLTYHGFNIYREVEVNFDTYGQATYFSQGKDDS